MPVEGSFLLNSPTCTKCLLSAIAVITASAGAAEIAVPGDFADLQAAIDAATPGDEIVVSPGEYQGNIQIDKDVIVRSLNGADSTSVLGNGNGPAVILESSDSQGGALIGFTVSGGAGQNGGGLFLSGDVAVIDCTVTGNTAQNGGGAFIVGSPTLSAVRFHSNIADQGGGVFLSPDSMPLLDLCDFYENTADSGGGLYVSPRGGQTTYATIGAGSFERNTAVDGAGIYAEMGGFEVVDSEFIGNVASDRGGSVFVADGEFSSFLATSMEGGEADEGGAFFLTGAGEMRVQGSEIYENTSGPDSAAVTVADGFMFEMMGSALWANTPDSMSGAWEDLGDNEFSAPQLCEIDYVAPFGLIDMQDLMRFIDLFMTGQPEADLALPEGMLDLSDLLAFINMYYSGCDL